MVLKIQRTIDCDILQEGDPEADLPLEFDDHRRKLFEQTFLNELAFSAGIPKENFSIEEVRIFR